MGRPELIFYVVGEYPEGENKYVLHEQGCLELPGILMRYPIGIFETIETALVRANELFPGCVTCKSCPSLHPESLVHYTFGNRHDFLKRKF